MLILMHVKCWESLLLTLLVCLWEVADVAVGYLIALARHTVEIDREYVKEVGLSHVVFHLLVKL